ncbi:MAG: biotin carboxylase N-terminal domain-containing protein, partial [Myxococcota bacterium]
MGFDRVLIANRGEIAVRVARTLRDLGKTPVAVYSDADRLAPHVRVADLAYHVGKPPAPESYLDVKKILEVARKAKVDAIHPGYGFLSENADFAEAAAKEGITFIGPPAHATRLMGSKTAAREAMIKAGVPTVPGSPGAIESEAEAAKVAEEIGYPVMVKASAGYETAD